MKPGLLPATLAVLGVALLFHRRRKIVYWLAGGRGAQRAGPPKTRAAPQPKHGPPKTRAAPQPKPPPPPPPKSLATPHAGGPGLVGANQWARYDELGFVVLPTEQVFDAGELAILQRRLDEIQLGTADVPYARMMMQLDSATGRYEDAGEQTYGFKGPTLRYRKIQNLERDALVMAYLRKPIFCEACARVYGKATPISSFRTMLFSKPSRPVGAAAGGTALPWHQDRWKFLDRDPLLTVYLALDGATPQSGCVRLLPGSHRLGVLNPEHHSAFLTAEQAARHCSERARPLELVLQPGEVALIHNHVVHSSEVNTTDAPRRALSVSYMDARSNLAMEALTQQHPSGSGEIRSAGYPEALLPDGDAEGGPEFPLIFPGEREGVSTPRGGPLSRVRAVLRSARKTLDMRAALGEDEV